MVATLLACADETPLAPGVYGPGKVQPATLPTTDTEGTIATLQQVTARYHDLGLTPLHSSPSFSHLIEQLDCISHEPVGPRLKDVVPTLRVDTMDHEIRMILREAFVLVGNG